MTQTTDFEHDFASDEAAASATNEEVIVVNATFQPAVAEPEVSAADPEGDNDEDDFFAENAAPEVPAVDPAKVVTIIPSSSDNKYVEVEGPTPMLDLIHKSGLQFAGDFQCYLNNAEITLTTLVPGGSTVSIVGKVKGG